MSHQRKTDRIEEWLSSDFNYVSTIAVVLIGMIALNWWVAGQVEYHAQHSWPAQRESLTSWWVGLPYVGWLTRYEIIPFFIGFMFTLCGMAFRIMSLMGPSMVFALYFAGSFGLYGLGFGLLGFLACSALVLSGSWVLNRLFPV